MASIYRPLVGDEVRFVGILPGAWTDPIRCVLVYLPLPDAGTDLVEAWFSGRPLPKLLHQELYDPRPSGTTGSFGEGSTATAPKAETPAFIALSYAWGNSNRTEELLLDGHPVQKTVNLVAGLRQLRNMLPNASRGARIFRIYSVLKAMVRNPSHVPEIFRSRSFLRAALGNSIHAPCIFHNSSVLFWIDALCINQSDDAEKSAQVPRMGAIFGAAELVVSWLGENGQDDSDIHDLMDLINDVSYEDHSMAYDAYYRNLSALHSVKFHRILHTYKSLSRRPWFERMWVVQEMTMSKRTIMLAGSYWCYEVHFTGAYVAMTTNIMNQPLFDGGLSRLLRPLSYVVITRILSSTIKAIFEQRSTAGSNTPSITSRKEKDRDCDQQLRDCQETVVGMSRASIFADWANDARGFCESTAVAREYLSTRLLAFILRATLVSMTSGFKATIPHDYLYGILSLGGKIMYPRKLAPDYTLRFEDVFHRYTSLILEHTGDLAIVPRLQHGLKGVPSWVPDFRSASAFPYDCLGSRPLSVYPGVSVSGDGLICFIRGVRLAEVTMAMDILCKIGPEEEYITSFNRFDDFLKNVCKEQRLNKREVIEEVLETSSQYLNLDEFQRDELQEVYDDCVSASPSEKHGRKAHRDILLELAFTLGDSLCFATSRGVILSLTREHEQPRKGDVLVILEGAKRPWLIRPVAGSDQDEFLFVGACMLLYRNSQSSGLWHTDPRIQHVREKETERFFACNAVREFRLV